MQVRGEKLTATANEDEITARTGGERRHYDARLQHMQAKRRLQQVLVSSGSLHLDSWPATALQCSAPGQKGHGRCG